ncbi:hypothetical protein TELCIR_06763 [Teladorsagia circumcincta]|uniref:Serine carboxypeptidase S28 n=1 Tax=Teladorsagia circumcincta TaxID=45464 RepID=A0A2G9UM92_TELCI|nr:hypothetical protein TELCIR_06763 [Teladorsagia circumcincta]
MANVHRTRGSKVVFPNGSIDPWKSLGLLVGNPDKNVDAFMIEGTAHCADMYPASPNDKPSLKAARTRIEKNLDAWIKEALTPTGSLRFKAPMRFEPRPTFVVEVKANHNPRGEEISGYGSLRRHVSGFSKRQAITESSENTD